MKTPQKTKAAYGALGLIGAAYAIIDETIDNIEHIFGECYTGPFRRFLDDCDALIDDLKAEVEHWEEEEDENA